MTKLEKGKRKGHKSKVSQEVANNLVGAMTGKDHPKAHKMDCDRVFYSAFSTFTLIYLAHLFSSCQNNANNKTFDHFLNKNETILALSLFLAVFGTLF